MTVPLRPYLIRSYYDWMVENNWTPHLVVNAELPDVDVPQEHIKQGRIVLNVSPMACQGLHLKNDRIVLSARFQGVATQLSFPPQAVLAIYAKENSRGIMFGKDDNPSGGGDDGGTPIQQPKTTDKAPKAPKKGGKAKLTVVK